MYVALHRRSLRLLWFLPQLPLLMSGMPLPTPWTIWICSGGLGMVWRVPWRPATGHSWRLSLRGQTSSWYWRCWKGLEIFWLRQGTLAMAWWSCLLPWTQQSQSPRISLQTGTCQGWGQCWLGPRGWGDQLSSTNVVQSSCHNGLCHQHIVLFSQIPSRWHQSGNYNRPRSRGAPEVPACTASGRMGDEGG